MGDTIFGPEVEIAVENTGIGIPAADLPRLFDLRMEPVNGLTLMGAAHERRPRLPVLVMTAHGTIDNALEAMEAGGTLTLRTRRTEQGLVEAVVEDTGCGMSEETRARVFDLFFTTKDSGTGLGMAIVGTVVE